MRAGIQTVKHDGIPGDVVALIGVNRALILRVGAYPGREQQREDA
jgi:hypothetical protein